MRQRVCVRHLSPALCFPSSPSVCVYLQLLSDLATQEVKVTTHRGRITPPSLFPRFSSSLALPARPDTDRAGKQKSVRSIAIRYTDMALTRLFSFFLFFFEWLFRKRFWFVNYGGLWWMCFHPSISAVSSPDCLLGRRFQFRPGIAIDCPCRAQAQRPPSLPPESTACASVLKLLYFHASETSWIVKLGFFILLFLSSSHSAGFKGQSLPLGSQPVP